MQGIKAMNIKRCQGFSLISILVGLLISLIVISGSMLAFRASLHQIVPAATNADDDGQRMSGLLRAGRLVQGSGFGLSSPALGGDIRVLSGAVLTGSSLAGTAQAGSPAIGNAIIWRQDTSVGNCTVAANCSCYGLLSSLSGGLQLLFNTSCSGWPTPTWSNELLMDDGRQVQITVTDAACNPFGIAASETSGVNGIKTVTFSTTMSTEMSAGTETAITSTYCLANLQ